MPDPQMKNGAPAQKPQPPAQMQGFSPLLPLTERYLNQTIKTPAAEYHISRLIGGGGMGIVFLAHSGSTPVAIKFLGNDFMAVNDNRPIRRFVREAKALSLVNHPNVVKILDFGDHDGRMFLVMEYLDGPSLEKVLARQRLPWKTTREILLQICAGLGAAHDAGVLHRDMKPANIILMKGNHVKLIDFGMVKFQGHDVSALTSTGSAVGTTWYMAPEQFTNAPEDHRRDIYSVGVVMYELLTGTVPFKGNSLPAQCQFLLHEPVLPPSQRAPERGIPPEVDAVDMTALQRAPGERYPSADKFANAIKSCTWDGTPHCSRHAASRRRHGMPWFAKATLTLAIAGGAAWGAWQFREVRHLYRHYVAPYISSALGRVDTISDLKKMVPELMDTVHREKPAAKNSARAAPATPAATRIVAPKPLPHKPKIAPEPVAPADVDTSGEEVIPQDAPGQ